MSKNIDKKIRLLSTDIYQFSKDPVRELISKIDDESLEIIVSDQIKIIDTNESRLSNTNQFAGYVEMFCGEKSDDIVNAIKDIKNNSIKNSYIVLDKHFELNQEIKKAKLDNAAGIIKFECDFKYNYLSKNYETFIAGYPNLLELNYPYFYEIIGDRYSNPSLKQFDGRQLFETPSSFINTNNTRNELKEVILPPKLQFNNDYVNYYSINHLNNEFPHCCDIKIDFHSKNATNISDLFYDMESFNTLIQYSTEYNLTEKLAVSERGDFKDIQSLNKKIIDNRQIKDIMKIAFGKNANSKLIKYNNLLSANNVKFSDILFGKPNYSEVIGYILNKYDTFGSKSTPIQKFYIPNLYSNRPLILGGKNTFFNFIDTQIKYNKRYRYSIDLLVLNIEMVYKYTGAFKQTNQTDVRIEYTYEPRLNVLLVKNSAEYTNKLISKPPVKPFIETLPYVDTPNKFKFIIYNNNAQNVVEYPIAISDKDTDSIRETRDAQNSLDGKLTYSFDDGSALKFEVYKTTERPYSYNDLSNKLYKTIETKESETTGFEENITPEKNYYYCFRAIDIHGQFSNPTQIYEVVHSNGFLSVKPVSFDVPQEQNNKIFRRYMQISPSLAQLEMTGESEKDISLGINKESVWNKNFKIRLTSRSTGRKIDFNLTFKYIVRDNE